MSLSQLISILVFLTFGIPLVYAILYMIGLLFGTIADGFKEGRKGK